ncbi:MAG: site-specific DNA-methyltransferase, partial [Halioglobus sp.]|nr:site-specific DNA-methyltransferase [Halioglobus sp.]
MSNEPERVDLESPDIAAEKRAAFEELFPGVLSDGVLDSTRLGELLDTPVTAPADGMERFGLMWAGKQDAVRSLLTPGRGTLEPELDKSIDFDDAENVFIEGDNLEVLKLLQKAYNDRVKLIYIDPPYNTGGNDFIYPDNFSDTLRAYLEFTGQVDAEGNRTSATVDVLGRRHSRWLSMM